MARTNWINSHLVHTPFNSKMISQHNDCRFDRRVSSWRSILNYPATTLRLSLMRSVTKAKKDDRWYIKLCILIFMGAVFFGFILAALVTLIVRFVDEGMARKLDQEHIPKLMIPSAVIGFMTIFVMHC
jgi:hypothetical protein